jgi:uncharacterized protein YpmS
MNTKKYQILLVIMALILSVLACSFPTSLVKTKAPVVPTLPAAEQQQLQDQIASQVNNAAKGVPITIELTESQLTSMINSQAVNQQDAQFSGLQVTLNNNQATISGDVTASGVSGKVSIVLGVGTNDQGKPSLSIVSATMGGFPLPASMLSGISTAIDQALQNQTGQEFVIQSLAITDHKLIITAVKQ